MKAKPLKINPDPEGTGYVQCEVNEATHVELNMPCPLPNRTLPIILSGSRDEAKGVVWSWNGDTEKPTLKPSILTSGGRYYDDKYVKIRCHTFVNDGMVKFLPDCSHEFANQTIELLEVEDK